MDRRRGSRRVFGVLRWVVIAVFLLITVFPFYYMLVLSASSRSSGCCWTPARCGSAPGS